jgi:hypothetical protein
MSETRECEVEWCDNRHYAKGLCRSHYYYLKKTGRIAAKPDIDGRRKHPMYGAWAAMINRCHNPNNSSYSRYGARGIIVCDRWRQDFRYFLADMGERPEGMTLDRFPDASGNYEPGNCRWATIHEQRSNLSVDGDQRMRAAIADGVTARWQKWRAAGSPPLPPRSSKLSFEQVDAIRERLAAGALQREIAAAFGVSVATISDIARGKTRRFSPALE